MEVLLKLSLQGGHEWETTCDEDDPIVFGLVSALPGAALDASLPPDGLIQVEKKTGERLFLSRSSLVAVSVQRLPEGGQPARHVSPAAGSFPASRLTLPVPFALLDRFLGAELAAALVSLAAPGAESAEASQELEIDSLPSPIADKFVEAMEAAARASGNVVEAGAELDLRLFAVGAPEGAFALPGHATGGTVLVAGWPVGESMPQARLELADRLAGGIDPASGAFRVVELRSDQALVLADMPERGVIKLDWGREGGQVLFAVAALVFSSATGNA